MTFVNYNIIKGLCIKDVNTEWGRGDIGHVWTVVVQEVQANVDNVDQVLSIAMLL